MPIFTNSYVRWSKKILQRVGKSTSPSSSQRKGLKTPPIIRYAMGVPYKAHRKLWRNLNLCIFYWASNFTGLIHIFLWYYYHTTLNVQTVFVKHFEMEHNDALGKVSGILVTQDSIKIKAYRWDLHRVKEHCLEV